MEALAVLGGVAAGFVFLVLALKALLWLVVAVGLPLFWLWMLVDAVARRPEDYPTKTTNEKILWIVLMVVLQVSVAAYWFVVYRAARRGAVSAVPGAPVTPTAMVPASQPAAPTSSSAHRC